MKTFCIFLTVLLAGCSSKPPAAPVIKDNTELFKYVDGIELVVSDAASALTAIAENTDKKSVSWILLDAQISRLSGIKEPSVVKVGEYRTTITKNDAVAAAKDKDLAIKVDNETSLAWAKVEAMNSELAKAKLAKANSDAIAERAIKDNTISKVTSLGLGMILIGVIAIAFASLPLGFSTVKSGNTSLLVLLSSSLSILPMAFINMQRALMRTPRRSRLAKYW
jgi:hypothetical protein